MTEKIFLKSSALYPSPITILGTIVDNIPNFITIKNTGILNDGTPQYLSFGMSKTHLSNQGILENKVFSVNIPSKSFVTQTDYIGMVSGRNSDKSKVLDVFYGQSKNAPLIKNCPVTMECKLAKTINLPTHHVFIGKIIGTYANKEVFTDGQIDISKVDPLLFDMNSRKYWSLGKSVAAAWDEGKKVIKKLR